MKYLIEKTKEILKKLNNWKFIILLIFIIGASFYWFQIRPSKIYSNCHERATKSAIKEYSTYEGNNSFRPTDYELFYKQCLRLEGINK